MQRRVVLLQFGDDRLGLRDRVDRVVERREVDEVQ
jgi:hypothetical protein